MIDNFELIKSLLEFPNNDIYYHLQIIRRGKDHPELPAKNRMIKSYFINDINDLDFYEQEIKKLCEIFGARAYINLAPKSIERTTLLQVKYLSQRVYDGDYKKIWKSWDTCAGEVKGEKPRWVVDIDSKDKFEILEIKRFINSLSAKILPMLDTIPPTNRELVLTEIPTKNGIHLITKPFNLQQFKEKYPDIDIHKNNPTLLYCL